MPSTPLEKLAELRREFAAQLPQKTDAIRAQFRLIGPDAWLPNEAEALHRMVHSLTGGAGIFGMPLVSEAARAMEQRLSGCLKAPGPPNDDDWDEVSVALERLERSVQSALASDAPLLMPPAGEVPSAEAARAPLIYLVEDDLQQAQQLQHILEDAGYRVRVFTDLSSFAAVPASDERPAAVVMDMIFPEGNAAGAKAITELKACRADSPPVIFASVRDDIEARLVAYRAGAARYLIKPIDPTHLLTVLDEIAGRLPLLPYRVLLVDDEPLLLEAEATYLRQTGMEVETVSEPLRVLEVVRRFEPDVLVLDVYMPEATGPELAAVLREDEAHTHLPILFLSSETDISKQLLALNLGGDDFLVKPVEPAHLIAAVTARARRARQNADMLARLQHTLYEREREHLALNQHAIVSITDLTGRITYVNDKFCQVSGYSRDELLGQNHRILKSGQHPPGLYEEMWRTIAAGQIWQGTVCNRTKNGELYWVESTITPFLDEGGRPYQYVSIRTDITELKRREEAVRISDERLRRSQVFANIGTWDWNVQNGELYWSERIAALFGYPLGELETTYENFLMAVHPDDRDKVTSAVAACVERGDEYNVEHRVVWPDGQVRWVQEKGDVIRAPDGTPLHMLGVIIDIHHRKMAEEAQRESEEKFRNLFELSPVGIALNAMDGSFLEANAALLNATGYTLKELKALSYWALTPEEYAPQEQAQIDSMARTGRYGPYEKEYIHKDGHRFPVLLSGVVVQDRAGNQRIWSIVQDMTERKKSEQDLALFKRIFETSEQGIGVADANGFIVYSNSAHDRLHGYTHGEVIGTHITKFFSAETQQWAMPQIMGAIEQGKGWSGLLPILLPDGSEMVTTNNVGFIADDEGRPQFLFNLLSDYTPELRRQEQLSQAKEAAERANQAKSDFLSSMSHELRTPMNAILGFAQILEYDEQLDMEQKDSVHEIIKAGNHLLNLINEVLDLAKIESGNIDFSIEPIALADVLDECFSLIQPLAVKRAITLQLRGDAAAAVRADRVRLKQVLLNLLSNAIKYNREAGTVRLEVLPAEEGFLRIAVVDTGPGIPQERMGELFQPFNRLDAEHGNVEGTGIGLTITHRLIDLMGGQLGVESELGVGSTFWIELPAESLHQETVTKTEQPGSASTQELAEAYRILYIEDNPANLKLVSQILARQPHIRLITAHLPELGIELALAYRPDLILLDINMPGMDGYQVLQVFKADARLKGIPVIAVTAKAMERDIAKGRELGFTDYVTKPIDVAHFLQTIERVRATSTAARNKED